MKRIFLTIFCLLLSACVSDTDRVTPNQDPFEKFNRSSHQFNKSVDRIVIKPVSNVYGSIVPEPVRNVLANFSSNLSEPIRFINHSLQGNLIDAGKTSIRFGLNTTIGVVGLFDVASYFEIYQEDTSFDATLKVWDLPSGPYVELPFLGPNTVRGSIATLIDSSLDPIGSNINSNNNLTYYSTRVIDLLNSRFEFSDTIETILYDSFDSYESGKSYYLQSIGEGALENSEDELIDLYYSE